MMNYVTLNNGVKMPMVGYGIFEIPAEQTARYVFDALETGYRLIDTAQAYYNEKEVGDGIQRGIRELGIRREDIFLTTKVWVTEFGYEKTRASVEESLRKLQTDYLDLVLIHQCLSDYYGAYRALEDLYNEGKIRAIGISNFSAERMADIATFNRIIPAVNQVETHLFWQQYESVTHRPLFAGIKKAAGRAFAARVSFPRATHPEASLGSAKRVFFRYQESGWPRVRAGDL